ncbi:hypothetical protein U9M48_006607 [Paspalum notatum var. saurae]|uniref:DUF1618 domain-containing protein n=1 Tax=Paspalum notatum var. saurae TaxID=547442 RepID=A0AAQ3PSP2_PASNO
MASPSPQQSWVILAWARPRAWRPPGSSRRARATPPRLAHLTVAPTVFPSDPDPQARIAADASGGLFLVVAPPPVSERPPTRERVWRDPDSGVERTIRIVQVPRPAYFVLDVPAAAAARVPGAGDHLDMAAVGVLAGPREYMVVGLQIIVGGKEATLLCFSSEAREWVEKDVRNPLPRWMWSFGDVVSHGGVWWVDCAVGLLACDPFTDHPKMAYIPLPEVGGHGGGAGGGGGHGSCGYCTIRRLASRRPVQLSGGKFHCVDMGCASQGGAPRITMFTLDDPETVEWTPKYAMDFSGIWDCASYKAAGLPTNKAPEVALI